MIAATCFFLAGGLTGLCFRLAAIVALSALATLCFAALCLARGAFTGIDALMWLAAMTAIQTGYVIGSFVAAQAEAALERRKAG